jgi:hypothetical protein
MDDPLSRVIEATTRHAIRDESESAYAFDLAVFALHESLARIRAVVEAADGLPDWGPSGGATYARLQSVLDALTPDDRRLLGMDR